MAAVPITVPGVGESISEGILARWLKPDGAPVKAGEPLFELETDKASSDVPAAGSGVLQDRRRRGRDRGHRRDGRHHRPGRCDRDRGASRETGTRTAGAVNRTKAPPADRRGRRRAEPGRPRPARFRRPCGGSSPRRTSTLRRSPAPAPADGITKGDVLAFLESTRHCSRAGRRPRRSGSPSRRLARYRFRTGRGPARRGSG